MGHLDHSGRPDAQLQQHADHPGISGLGLGALMPATFSLLADHFPQSKRGRAMGTIGFVGAMGTVVGVLALGFVATPEMWRWGFIGLGVASILSGLIIWLLVNGSAPRFC
jgi:MFS family permease